VHRDNSGNLIGAPESAPRAQFDGLLEGRVLEDPTPSVIAFDRHSYGHMIIATNITVDALKYVAQAMHVVDNTAQRVMLFSLDELHEIDNQWVVAYPPDAGGEDAAHPNICDAVPDSPPRVNELAVRFEPAANSSNTPPNRILQQSVVSFTSAS